MQAHKLHLPLHHHRPSSSADPNNYSSSASPAVSSLLVEPSSRSLALMLSDSSVLLYPPFPALPSPAHFPLPTFVSPFSTAVCFLRLQPCPTSNPGRVLFVSAASEGASIHLRAWILSLAGSSGCPRFAPVRLSYRQDRLKPGILLDLRHGFSVTLAASINVFVVHSSAVSRICVYAARLVGQGGEETAVEIIKCAAIECTSPIFSIQMSPGFLLLGEVGGIRVFPLRQLIKGWIARPRDSRRKVAEEKKLDVSRELFYSVVRNLPNGVSTGLATGKNNSLPASVAHSDPTVPSFDSKGGAPTEREVHVTSDGKNGADRSNGSSSSLFS